MLNIINVILSYRIIKSNDNINKILLLTTAMFMVIIMHLIIKLYQTVSRKSEWEGTKCQRSRSKRALNIT